MTGTVDRTGLEIAVVGLACRLPGARDPREFWRNLREGRECVSFFSVEELSGKVEPALLADDAYIRAAAVLDDVELFDADFFGFSPREAEILDPQHRHFLECAWEALEDAGYAPEKTAARIGIYAGTSLNSYLFEFYDRSGLLDPVDRYQTLLLSDKDYLPTRVAYKLGLTGPGVAVQTACSTSLVAVHLACRALLGGECDLALAGGVSIKVPHRAGYLYREGGIASPDGHCRAFDARAAGAVGGNGLGIVVLKRLDEALEDGDQVRAVIRGSAVNNDGALKAGYTAPGVAGQREVVEAALLAAEVDPRTVSYVEAHGSGTALGDPIEVAALTEAFRSRGDDGVGQCGLGSVKTGIGHLDAAAGIAGLIKTVLALEHRELPASLHFERPNPALELDASPFYVVRERRPWTARDGHPRRAGVSSFGIGGTNAHAVLEEAPPREERPLGSEAPWHLLRLSARTPAALEEATDRLARHLDAHPELDLADVAGTLHAGRRAFAERRVAVCRDREHAIAALSRRDLSVVAAARAPDEERPVAFLFPGLGVQRTGMAADLYRYDLRFREELDRCAELLSPHLGADLRGLLLSAGATAPGGEGSAFGGDGGSLRRLLRPGASVAADDPLQRTALAQPALFAVEYALARTWIEWGVVPRALLGYSLGEYVAACLAGVLSLSDALRIVALRAALIERLPAGAMVAVPLPEETVRDALDPDLSVSAVNGPSVTVVAGPVAAVERYEGALARAGVVCQRVWTTHAFHTEAMREAAEATAAWMSEIALSPPAIPYLSNLTGTWIRPEEATSPAYWARHTREPVRFGAAVRELWAHPRRVLLEVGPGQTLGSLAAQHPERGDAAEHVVLASLPGPEDRRPAVPFLLGTVGRLWLAGVDTAPGVPGAPFRRVPLPTYPFERRRFWIGGKPRARQAPISAGLRVRSWKRATPLPGLAAEDLERPGGWLVLADGEGGGAALVERLEGLAVPVVRVLPGRRYARLGPRSYQARPGSAEDLDLLAAELAGRGPVARGILHARCLPRWGGEEDERDRFERWQRLGFLDVGAVAEALKGVGAAAEARVTVVASGLFRVLGDDPVLAARATLAAWCGTGGGPGGLPCRCVDVAPPAPGSDAWVDLVLRELVHGDEPLVAHRHGERWVPVAEELTGLPESRHRAVLPGSWILAGRLDDGAAAAARSIAASGGSRFALIETPEAPGPVESEDGGPDLEGLEAEALEALRGAGFTSYAAFQELADRFSSALVLRFLAAAGVDVAPGAVHVEEELHRHLGTIPERRRLAAYLLDMLAEDRVLERRDGEVRFLAAAGEAGDPDVLRREVESRESSLAGLLDLLELAVGSFGEVLSGRLQGLEVLYPQGDSDRVESLYAGLERFRGDRVYIETVRRWISALAARDRGRPLRILEVGAGNGFLTRELAPDLVGRPVEYVFTDLGKGFVAEGRRAARRQGWDFMRFGVLDASRDPVGQGYEAEGFDLVLGLNVVHATPRIESTLEHLTRLLAPGGRLVLIEGVKAQRWNNLIWGLTDGWWSFEDGDLRSSTPLLPRDRWQELLARREPEELWVLPTAPALREELDHALLVLRPAETTRGGRLAAELRTGGAEVVSHVRLPEPDSEALRRAVERAAEELGGAGGLLWSAGAGAGLAGDLSTLARDIEARARGVLDALAGLAGAPPEIVVACAGTMAPETETRVAPGAAAGCFLEAFAAAAPAGQRRLALGAAGGGPAAGVDLPALLARPSLGAVFPAVSGVEPDAPGAGAGGERPGAGYERPVLGTPFAPPETDLERRVARTWEEVLGIEKVGRHDNFFDLGGDSLVGLKVAARLQDRLPAAVPAQTLFDHPTVEALARALQELLLEALEGMSDAEAERLVALEASTPMEVDSP